MTTKKKNKWIQIIMLTTALICEKVNIIMTVPTKLTIKTTVQRRKKKSHGDRNDYTTTTIMTTKIKV